MNRASQILLPILALFCLLPFVSGGMALLIGVVFALTLSNPYVDYTRKLTSKLLAFGVIGLGAGMNLLTVAQAGINGLGYTAISIFFTLCIGIVLGLLFKTSRDTSILVSVGTAICGGSAIAAIAPVIRAKHADISVSLAVVFILNAVALLVFPAIGHSLGLSQHQFGLWSALAIHDTSSVVGAGIKYGSEALQIGTTVKLARALWIVPLVFAFQFWQNRQDAVHAQNGAIKRKYPWFILGFLAMAAIVTFVPELASVGEMVEFAARRLLVVTLFLIGANLTRDVFKTVGFQPLAQAILLWLIAASASLAAIMSEVIK